MPEKLRIEDEAKGELDYENFGGEEEIVIEKPFDGSKESEEKASEDEKDLETKDPKVEESSSSDKEVEEKPKETKEEKSTEETSEDEFPSSFDDLLNSDQEEPEQDKEKTKPEDSKVLENQKPSEELTKVPRDFSGFSPEEAEYLKRMSNDAFEYVAPKLRQLAKIQESSADVHQSFYENPQAFTLTPTYKNLTAEFQELEGLRGYFETMLTRAHAQEPIADLRRDPSSGNYTLSEERPASPSDIVRLQQALSRTILEQDGVRKQTAKLQSDFLLNQQSRKQGIEEFANKHFGKFLQDTATTSRVEKALKEINMDQSLATPLLKGMYAALVRASAEVKKLRGILKENKVVTAEQRAADIAPSDMRGSLAESQKDDGNSKGKVLDIADFD